MSIVRTLFQSIRDTHPQSYQERLEKFPDYFLKPKIVFRKEFVSFFPISLSKKMLGTRTVIVTDGLKHSHLYCRSTNINSCQQRKDFYHEL